jgi:hypothetical protein
LSDFCCCDKTADINNLREEEFILAHDFRFGSIVAGGHGRAVQFTFYGQKTELAENRKQKSGLTGFFFLFSFILSVSPAYWMVHIHSGQVSPLSQSSLETSSWTHPEVSLTNLLVIKKR